MSIDASKVNQNAAVSTVFLFTQGENPLPATVFYQTDSEWIACELCKLFKAEYGQNCSNSFHFATVQPECITDFVRLQSAISDLSLYQDPDPGIYDPEPTPDLLLRATYCFRAKEWEDALRHLRENAKCGSHGEARPIVPQGHPTSEEVDAFEGVRNSLEKHRLMFLYFAAPKRLNPTATGNRWEMETMSQEKFPKFDPDEIDESGDFLITHRRRLESFVQSAYSQFGSGMGCKPRVMTESGTVVDIEGGSFPAWYLDEAACVHLEESSDQILSRMRDAVRSGDGLLLRPFVSKIKQALHDEGKAKWYASDPVQWAYLSRIDSVLHELRTAEFGQREAGVTSEGQSCQEAPIQSDAAKFQNSDEPSMEDVLKEIPEEDERNSSLIILLLLAQAYYTMLESTVRMASWFTVMDLGLNHSYLWTIQSIRNLLKNKKSLADFPMDFEPALPDLYPSTLSDLEWEYMIAPAAEEFLATVQRYTIEKGYYDPKEGSLAHILVELVRPGVEVATQRADAYYKRLRKEQYRIFNTPNSKSEEATQETINKAESQTVDFELPVDVKWQELNMRFVDSHTITVKIRGISKRLQYSDLQMIDGRSRGPTKQWYLLENFAKGRGFIDWNSPGASRENRKRRKILSDNLKAFFKIPGEPIVLSEDKKGWKTVFQVAE